MVTVSEALAIIEQTETLQEAETVSVYDCAGRIAAEDLVSQLDQPPFPRSPLDGFAFRSEDVQGASENVPARLFQIGYVPAGCGEVFSVGSGECVRIMTGGRIPETCDAVIGIEHAAYEEETGTAERPAVLIKQPVKHFGNYVFAGEDFAKGDKLCSKGDRIDCAAAACLAAASFAEVPVVRRPRIAVLATGSEIVSPGSPLPAGKIYDSNSVYLKNRLKQLGFDADIAFCPDEPEKIREIFSAWADAYDLVISTGGVSVGDADYVPDVLKGMGAAVRFQGAALKPGSPLMLAEKSGAQFLCLSGNPYAAAATFELFGRPLLAKLAGDASLQPRKDAGKLAKPFAKGSKVPRYLRAKLEQGLLYVPEGHSSGQMLSMAGCNCLAELPAGDGPFEAGTELNVTMF